MFVSQGQTLSISINILFCTKCSLVMLFLSLTWFGLRYFCSSFAMGIILLIQFQGLPVFAIGAGLSTFDKASVRFIISFFVHKYFFANLNIVPWYV